MAAKEKKPKGPPDHSKQQVLPNDFAVHASEIAGMTSEEIIRLLETMEKVDDSIVVTRRRADKNGKGSKDVGGKNRRMSINDAIEYEKKRLEERIEKEENVRKLIGIDEAEQVDAYEEIYPKRLSPNDIVRYVESAEEKLEEMDRHRTTRKKVFTPREENVLNILTLIKQQEAERVARKIAFTQKDAVAGKTLDELDALRQKRIDAKYAEIIAQNNPEGDADAATSTETATKDEWGQPVNHPQETPPRTLQGFKKGTKTLIDEAGEITADNLDLAAAVVKQWIGHAKISE